MTDRLRALLRELQQVVRQRATLSARARELVREIRDAELREESRP